MSRNPREERADGDGSDAELADALIVLRNSLLRAQEDGADSRIKFSIEHVDLTLQVTVSKASKGNAGVKWHVLALGSERSKQQEGVQTLNLRLKPIVVDEHGVPLPGEAQHIAGFEVPGER